MNDVVTNLALAAHYQRRAALALLPPRARGHAEAAGRELRALAVALLTEPLAHEPRPSDGAAPAASETQGRPTSRRVRID